MVAIDDGPAAGSVDATRALLAELRVVLSDQASLGFGGLEAWAPRAPVDASAPAQQSLGVGPAAGPSPAALPAAKAQAGPHAQIERPTLALVREQLGDCTRCKLHAARTTIVFGTGSPRAELMFVGEGPGRDEDLEGEPFVGEAGRLLGRMLQAMGTGRQAVYIANVIKCRPPKNRFPEREEIATCLPFLTQQVHAIGPKVVVALGRCALESLLGRPAKISKERGQWLSLKVPGGEVALMPTFHPAYLLRNPADKGLVWQDLQAVMARLQMPLPGRSGPGPGPVH